MSPDHAADPLVGHVVEELSEALLEYEDPRFPLTAAVYATKP